jgi:hypothetical protein
MSTPCGEHRSPVRAGHLKAAECRGRWRGEKRNRRRTDYHENPIGMTATNSKALERLGLAIGFLYVDHFAPFELASSTAMPAHPGEKLTPQE